MVRHFDLYIMHFISLFLPKNSNTPGVGAIIARTVSSVLVFFVFASIGYLSTFSLLKVEMSSPIESDIQVYWSDESAGFSEEKSQKQAVTIGKRSYWFWVNHFNKSTHFRIDPVTAPTHLRIDAIKLYSLFYSPIDFNLLNDPVKINDIVVADNNGASQHAINIESIAGDPQIEIRPIQLNNIWFLIVLVLVIALVLFKGAYIKKVLVFIIGFMALYALLNSNTTRLILQTAQPMSGQLKVFWRDAEQANSYMRARTINIRTDQEKYVVPIGNVSNIEVLYLQPNKENLLGQFKDINILEPGFSVGELNAETIIDKKKDFSSLIRPLIGFFVVYSVLALIFMNIGNKNQSSYLLYALAYFSFFIVALLIISLSWQADYNIHPDENAHIEAVHYYSHYWDPPVVGDTRSLETYQEPWAISRLDDLGISYFFAGKFENLVQLFFSNTTFTARAFNAFLFILLFSYSRQKRLVLFLAPLLCTPQIWYLYSYANRDAFALFISLLLAWQLVNVKSSLNHFLQSSTVFGAWRYLLLPAGLLGLLSIEQTNYYLFILFVFSFLLWRALFFVQAKKVFIYKCLLLLCAALLVFVVRFGLDIAINGEDKLGQRMAYAEQHAGEQFKPSIASTPESYPGLRLKDKGISLSALFAKPWDWHKMTFKSFTGFYGYYAEYSPRWYYLYVLIVYSMLLLLAMRHAIFVAEWRYQLFTVLTGIAVAGGVLMGILFSWLYDFQPQGRYIFPIIPIILVYFGVIAPFWTQLERAVVLASAFILIVLSVYSFNEVALNYLFA